MSIYNHSYDSKSFYNKLITFILKYNRTPPYPRSNLVWPYHPGTSRSNSNNSGDYEQILRKMDMQVIEFQFFINLFSMSIGIVDIIFAGIQCHQWNTIIQRETLFVSQLYKNQKKFTTTLLFTQKQIHIQSRQNLYYNLCLPPQTHTPDPTRKLLSVLNPP